MSNPNCREEWKQKCFSNPRDGNDGRCWNFMQQELAAQRDTMDSAVLSFCSSNSDSNECACMNIPKNVRPKVATLKRAYGDVPCWFMPCNNREALMTLGVYRESTRCKNNCLLSASDFDQGVVPKCPAERIESRLWTPLNPYRLQLELDVLMRPLRLFDK